MENVSIPPFIKDMGHRFLSHIFNIDEEKAIDLINDNLKLDKERTRYLNGLVAICRQSRIASIDKDANAIENSIFSSLIELIVDDRHAFNIWREKLGGKNLKSDSKDPVIRSATKLAFEVYPLFLINIPEKNNSIRNTPSQDISLFDFKEKKILCDEIMKDESISKLFTKESEDIEKICGFYTSSSGTGGIIQLITFPNLIINKAFELIQLRSSISQEKLAEAIEEVICMLRKIANKEVIKIPIFMGFNNTGFSKDSNLMFEWGKVITYSPVINNLIPDEARPTYITAENKFAGFVLEIEYKCKFDYKNQNEFSLEVENMMQAIETIKENVCLTFLLAFAKPSQVSVTHAWTKTFDPLLNGATINWPINKPLHRTASVIQTNQQRQIQEWSVIINKSNDMAVRIAIKKILSAINERRNPADGLIDIITAWENLFGGRFDISFRISISIAKILKETIDERLELQKKISEYYNLRSTIVHGGKIKNSDYERIVKGKEECVQITIDLLRELYKKHKDLLDNNSSERSKRIALM